MTPISPRSRVQQILNDLDQHFKTAKVFNKRGDLMMAGGSVVAKVRYTGSDSKPHSVRVMSGRSIKQPGFNAWVLETEYPPYSKWRGVPPRKMRYMHPTLDDCAAISRLAYELNNLASLVRPQNSHAGTGTSRLSTKKQNASDRAMFERPADFKGAAEARHNMMTALIRKAIDLWQERGGTLKGLSRKLHKSEEYLDNLKMNGPAPNASWILFDRLAALVHCRVRVALEDARTPDQFMKDTYLKDGVTPRRHQYFPEGGPVL